MTPWTVAHQASLYMGFPRQEYWSGLPFPSPGDLPSLGIKPTSSALAGGFFATVPPGKPLHSPVRLVKSLTCVSTSGTTSFCKLLTNQQLPGKQEMPRIQNHFSALHFSAPHLLPQTWAAWVALNLNLCLSSHGGSDGKASVYNEGDPGSIPVLGRSPGKGNGNPLQHSC